MVGLSFCKCLGVVSLAQVLLRSAFPFAHVTILSMHYVADGVVKTNVSAKLVALFDAPPCRRWQSGGGEEIQVSVVHVPAGDLFRLMEVLPTSRCPSLRR